METRNDRSPRRLGCRQPRVKQKGKPVGVGVGGDECSLLITRFRGVGSWLLFVAPASTKVTVTSPLIRKRSPPPPPSRPCGWLCGKRHPLPKIPTGCCWRVGVSWGNGFFFVFSFHFGAEVSRLRSRRISAREHFLLVFGFLLLSFVPHKFFRGGTVTMPSILLRISVQISTHLLNLRAQVSNGKQTQSVAASPSSH